jgi:hypothetical protein
MGNRVESQCVGKIMQRPVSPAIVPDRTMPRRACSHRAQPASATTPRPSLWRALVVLALLLVAIGSAHGQDVPSFQIERITVTGVILSTPEVIISESHLEIGRSYRESELRQAVYRIERLPFVLAADFSLRKGGERGSYELVIAVTEFARFFVVGEALEIELHDFLDRPDETHEDEDNDYVQSVAGARAFVGRYLELSAAVAPTSSTAYRDDFINIQVAATHYNLGLIVPTGARHALRLKVNLGHSGDSHCYGIYLTEGRVCHTETTSRSADLRWLFDTTDDPYTPTLGSTLSFAAYHQRGVDHDRVQQETTTRWENRDEVSGIALRAARFFSLRSRQSLGLHAGAVREQVEYRGWSWRVPSGATPTPSAITNDSDIRRASLGVTHYLVLVAPPRTLFTQWWLETRAEYRHHRSETEQTGEGWWPYWHKAPDGGQGVASITVGGRGRWGFVRFTLIYEGSVGAAR